MKTMKRVNLAFVALLLGLVVAPSLPADGPELFVPLNFYGWVKLGDRDGEPLANLEVWVRRGEKAVTGLEVRLEDRVADFISNHYACIYNGFRLAAGSPLTVTFREPGVPARLRPMALTATAVMPTMLSFTAPADKSSVSGAARELAVSWRGDSPPYSLRISSAASGAVVFEQPGILGTSVNVPMRVFARGAKYNLRLRGRTVAFTFSGPVAAASSFNLDQWRTIQVAVD